MLSHDATHNLIWGEKISNERFCLIMWIYISRHILFIVVDTLNHICAILNIKSFPLRDLWSFSLVECWPKVTKSSITADRVPISTNIWLHKSIPEIKRGPRWFWVWCLTTPTCPGILGYVRIPIWWSLRRLPRWLSRWLPRWLPRRLLRCLSRIIIFWFGL